MKVSASAYELTGLRARSQCVEGNLVQGRILSGRNWYDVGRGLDMGVEVLSTAKASGGANLCPQAG